VLVREFEWDEGNLQHLAERGLAADEIDGMLQSRMTAIRNKRSGSGTYKLVGRGRSGRPLTIVVTETAITGMWRPITGWESTDAERRACR
jgi:hypothetical protein